MPGGKDEVEAGGNVDDLGSSQIFRLPDVLATLADCPKARSVNIHDRCAAKFEGL